VDSELEVIRHQMEEKRASLADKLDALEHQVLDTVHEATSEVSHIVQEVKSTVGTVTEGVQETVETVKETLTEGVQETVDTVKQTFDISDHVRRRPWMAMGGAIAAGVAGGYLLPVPGERAAPRSAFTPEPSRVTEEPRFSSAPAREPEPSQSVTSSALSAIEDAGGEALSRVRELAVGALMGVLGQMVARNVPDFLKDESSKLIRDLTTRLGGKVLDLSKFDGNQSASTKGETGGNGYQAEMGRPLGSV
jgi:ElaB/YqjD/DUF883 family membrane-anchored ribosome-binding protein